MYALNDLNSPSRTKLSNFSLEKRDEGQRVLKKADKK